MLGDKLKWMQMPHMRGNWRNSTMEQESMTHSAVTGSPEVEGKSLEIHACHGRRGKLE